MRELYGLEFYRNDSAGINYPFVSQKVYKSINSVLTFIGRLNEHETESLIYDLNRSISLQANADEGFFSDSVEDLDIIYQYPNVNIEDVLVIPMSDLRDVLEGWLSFITA